MQNPTIKHQLLLVENHGRVSEKSHDHAQKKHIIPNQVGVARHGQAAAGQAVQQHRHADHGQPHE